MSSRILDSCPAHNTAHVREYLRTIFGEGVISGYGNVLWPAKSPDLSPWSYRKSKLYIFQEGRDNNINELRGRIINLLGKKEVYI